MKYAIPVHEFSFNKIKSGSRKVGVHLLDKQTQQVKLGDVLELHNNASGEVLSCEVKGIALFDNFDDLVDALSPQALGYDNKKEVMIRLERMYPQDAQAAFNAVGFFLQPKVEKVNLKVRGELER